MHPRARSAELIVRRLEDEVVVYDRRRHRAHCLNRSAAEVLGACDGRRTPREIGRLLGLSMELVWTALTALSKAQLLEAPVAVPPRAPSRRQALKAAGVLVPAVLTVLAPATAEAAQSCLDLNKNCQKNHPPPCCPGLTCRDVQVGGSTQTRCVP
jgi:hypothetical protein